MLEPHCLAAQRRGDRGARVLQAAAAHAELGEVEVDRSEDPTDRGVLEGGGGDGLGHGVPASTSDSAAIAAGPGDQVQTPSSEPARIPRR